MKTVLKGKEWKSYFDKNDKNDDYLTAYVCTYKYVQIFKIKDYYYSFDFYRGYKNISSLKREISKISYH